MDCRYFSLPELNPILFISDFNQIQRHLKKISIFLCVCTHELFYIGFYNPVSHFLLHLKGTTAVS